MARPPSPLTRKVTEDLRALMAADPDPARLAQALRLLAKWRSQLLERTVLERDGTTVQGGPFHGMVYDVPASEGARVARLLGCYENSLAPIIEEIVARGYPTVIDIGCAEGYYAVGLARRMPGTRILAHDTDPVAQDRCARLAALNGVAERVHVGGLVEHATLAALPDHPTVLICDIEGAEEALLDPARAPGLTRMDILVEVHEGMRPGLLQKLTARFAPSHSIRRIDRVLDTTALPAWMEGLSDLDRLLALWEWRASPTPWLWMLAND